MNALCAYSQTVSFTPSHPDGHFAIGKPEILPLNSQYPSFQITSNLSTNITVNIFYNDELLSSDLIGDIQPLQNIIWQPDILLLEEGHYKIDFFIHRQELSQDSPLESFYFTVQNKFKTLTIETMPVHMNRNNKLTYLPDFRGNQIPDFSQVGYKHGEDIPFISSRIVEVKPLDGDNTKMIQNIIDSLSLLPKNMAGIRGVVKLNRGVFEIKGTLRVPVSGIIIRGEDSGSKDNLLLNPDRNGTFLSFKRRNRFTNQTILVFTSEENGSAIRVRGQDSPLSESELSLQILENYVPVGAKKIRINTDHNLAQGDQIIIKRKSNANWISAIGMDAIPPRPQGGRVNQWEPFELSSFNEITEIDNNTIYLRYPLTNAIEREYSEGSVVKVSEDRRIEKIGFESLRAISFWKPDEHGVDNTAHLSNFLMFSGVKHAWVRNVVAEHFMGAAGGFHINGTSTNITIESSSNLIADRKFYGGPQYHPEGVTHLKTRFYTGRYGFSINGSHNLIKNVYAENNRHAFVFGAKVAGPNVFYNSKAVNSLTYSEPHHRWSTGGLYDNVEDKIALMNRLWFGSGHGWAGANYVAWNTKGELICQQPPTAQNWAIGHVGKRLPGRFIDYAEDGFWMYHNQHVLPRSLYLAQRSSSNLSQSFLFSMSDIALEDFSDQKLTVFPNPARYLVTFNFKAAPYDSVEISIIDFKGRKVGAYKQTYQQKGDYQIRWEAVDSLGKPLPRGVYVFKFNSKNISEAGKLILAD